MHLSLKFSIRRLGGVSRITQKKFPPKKNLDPELINYQRSYQKAKFERATKKVINASDFAFETILRFGGLVGQ